MKKVLILVIVIVMMFSTAIPAFADAIGSNTKPVDYYVYVDTPDGGLNMRRGQGAEYPKALDYPIPDGVLLHITAESTSGIWGLTEYDGTWGFVYLPQTSSTPPTPPTEASKEVIVITEYITVPATQASTTTTTTSPTTTKPVSETTEEETTLQTVSVKPTSSGRSLDLDIMLVAVIIFLVIVIAALLIVLINNKSKRNH